MATLFWGEFRKILRQEMLCIMPIASKIAPLEGYIIEFRIFLAGWSGVLRVNANAPTTQNFSEVESAWGQADQQ